MGSFFGLTVNIISISYSYLTCMVVFMIVQARKYLEQEQSLAAPDRKSASQTDRRTHHHTHLNPLRAAHTVTFQIESAIGIELKYRYDYGMLAEGTGGVVVQGTRFLGFERRCKDMPCFSKAGQLKKISASISLQGGKRMTPVFFYQNSQARA